MKTIIPDASVLLKWVIPPANEYHVEQAMQTATVQLVSHFQVTFYDAAYHALAIEQDGFFVTADEKYIQKAGSAGHIVHLKDWTS